MRWIVIVGGGIGGLVAIALLIGLLLPREHRASRSALIHQSPDSVWNAIRDLAGVPVWWSEMKHVERLRDSSGREVWRQRMSGFPVTLEVAEEQPARRPMQAALGSRSPRKAGSPTRGRWGGALGKMSTPRDVVAVSVRYW
jgi:hypothetical protein